MILKLTKSIASLENAKEKIEEKIKSLQNTMDEITDKALDDDRELTRNEQKRFDKCVDDIEELMCEIDEIDNALDFLTDFQ